MKGKPLTYAVEDYSETQTYAIKGLNHLCYAPDLHPGQYVWLQSIWVSPVIMPVSRGHRIFKEQNGHFMTGTTNNYRAVLPGLFYLELIINYPYKFGIEVTNGLVTDMTQITFQGALFTPIMEKC